MKNLRYNLYIYFALSLFITSCSTENENNFPTESNQIIKKTNKTTENEDFNRFVVKYSEVFENVKNNSNLTEEVNHILENKDFNKINHADEKLQSLIYELEFLYKKYEFEYVNKKLDDLLFYKKSLIEPGLDGGGLDSGNNTTLGPCENGCINAGVACGREVDRIYNLQMDYASYLLFSGNAPAAAILATAARIGQGIGHSNCANALYGCMEGC